MSMTQFPAYMGAQKLELDQPQVYHLANWGRMSDPQRLAFLRKIVQSSGRDPRIRELANTILRNAGVDQRKYQQQAAAILAWVQSNIQYTNEPGEILQDPLYTVKHRHGDCLPLDTLLLTEDYKLTPICDVRPGQKIWGKDRWSSVVDVWEKGPLEVLTVKLNNGLSFRATAGHKVFVDACKRHGPHCRSYNVRCREREEVRIHVSDIEPGDILVQPEKIACSPRVKDPRIARLEGLYLADGWIKFSGKAWDSKVSSFCIAGKDGHPKEEQKRLVQSICTELGITTTWCDRWINVCDDGLAERLSGWGHGAREKRLPDLDYDQAAAEEIMEGLLADATRNTHGDGRTYSTISPQLAVQMRVLWRMLGGSSSARWVTDHGGLGNNPICRVGLRCLPTAGHTVKRLRVTAIERDGSTVPCFDITTDDHYVYLPEADVTVSNCDDCAILLAALYESIALPWQFVLSGVDRSGRKVRWVEGTSYRHGVNWAHIYVVVGWPPFRPRVWAFAEPTIRGVPLGWDVVGTADQGIRPRQKVQAPTPTSVVQTYMPEMAGMGAVSSAGGIVATAAAEGMDADGGLNWRQIGVAVIIGVATSVASELVLGWIRKNYLGGKP